MAWWSRGDETSTQSPSALSCSFCGKTQHEVTKLVAGPEVYICDECVAICAQVLREDPKPPAFPEQLTADALLRRVGGGVVGHTGPLRQLAAALALHAHGGLEGSRGPTVLLVGPGGCGKTTLVRALAEAAEGLPYHIAAAHRITATGYIGEDIESLLFEVYEHARRDLALARRGLMVLEDLHHAVVRPPAPGTVGNDVTGAGVQRALLRVLDGQRCRITERSPAHPQMQGWPMETAALQVVLTARLDPLPAGAQAIREALLEVGIAPELLSRIHTIVPLSPLARDELATVLTAHLWPRAAERLAGLGLQVALAEGVADAVAERALGAGDGAWHLTQTVAAWEQRAAAAGGGARELRITGEWL